MGVLACRKSQDPQALQPGQPGYAGAPGYGQPGYGQPGYGQPGYGQPTATMTATAPPPQAGAPYAPPCQQPEGTCGWAKCNMSTQRCSWPCASAADCVSGSQCLGIPGTPFMGCAPAFPGMAPTQ